MEEHKKCTKCGQEKNVSEFYIRKNRKGAPLFSQCKKCRDLARKKPEIWKKLLISSREWKKKNAFKVRVSAKKYYSKNKDRLKILHSNYYKRSKGKWIKFIIDNGFNKCSICGYDKCFDAIHFHHKERTDKKKTIGYLYYLPMTAENIGELFKCQPVCANCHAEIHAKERNGIKWISTQNQ